MLDVLAFLFEHRNQLFNENKVEEQEDTLENCGAHRLYEEFAILEGEFTGGSVLTLREVFTTFEGFLFHYRSCEEGAVQMQSALIAAMAAFNCLKGHDRGFPQPAAPLIIREVIRTMRGMIPDVSRTRGAAIDMFDALDELVRILRTEMGSAANLLCAA